MSTYRGHIAGGVATYALTAFFIAQLIPTHQWPWYAHPAFIASTILGALFPDIDTRSMIQQFFLIALIAALPLTLIYNVPIFIGLSITCLGALFIPHRTLTHRPWFLIALSLLLATIAYTRLHNHRLFFVVCCAYFCAGALSHWFLDFGLRRLFPKK